MHSNAECPLWGKSSAVNALSRHTCGTSQEAAYHEDISVMTHKKRGEEGQAGQATEFAPWETWIDTDSLLKRASPFMCAHTCAWRIVCSGFPIKRIIQPVQPVPDYLWKRKQGNPLNECDLAFMLIILA